MPYNGQPGLDNPSSVDEIRPQSRSLYCVTAFPQPAFSAMSIVISIASCPVASLIPAKWLIHLTFSVFRGTKASLVSAVTG